MPKRTAINRMARSCAAAAPREVVVERLAIHLGEALRGAEHGHRLDRLVGRDHHHGGRAGGDGGVGDVDRAEHVGLDALPPVLLQQRHVLERRRMEHDVGPKIVHQAEDAGAVAHVGKTAFDLRPRLLGREHLQHGVQRRLGVLDHQHAPRAEGHDAIADFGADRPAAAGHDDRFVPHEVFEPMVVDLHAGPQQQVLDIDRRKPQRLAAVVERRKPAGGEPETPRPHQDRFRLRFGRERARREHEPCHVDAAIAEIGDDALDVVRTAEHGNAAYGLAPIGQGRRQDAHRTDLRHRAAFDRTQQHVGVGGAANDEDRRRTARLGVLKRAGVAEIAIGDARARQKCDLQQPIEHDRDLAEEERAVDVRRQQHVIERQQRHRQHRRGAHDVEEIGQRGEAPLRLVEAGDAVDEAGIDDEGRQQDHQEPPALR